MRGPNWRPAKASDTGVRSANMTKSCKSLPGSSDYAQLINAWMLICNMPARSPAMVKNNNALMRRLRGRRGRLFQKHDQHAEAKIKHRQQEKGVAVSHDNGLAMHDLRQLLHRHQRGVAHPLQALGEYVERFGRGGVAPGHPLVQ